MRVANKVVRGAAQGQGQGMERQLEVRVQLEEREKGGLAIGIGHERQKVVLAMHGSGDAAFENQL